MNKTTPTQYLDMLENLNKMVMTNYTAEEISKNHDKFLNVIKTEFSDIKRINNLKIMYDDYGLELATAPASGKEHFHNAYPGGYIDHIMNVLKNAKLVKRLYQHGGGRADFTDEELSFAAIHHDLGKLGFPNQPYYIENESEWHRKNQGLIYKFNPDLQYMEVTDRALFILQKYGIVCTWRETLAIKLSDGLYEEANGKYLKTFDPNFQLKTNLPYIIHWADHMSCRQEHDNINKK